MSGGSLWDAGGRWRAERGGGEASRRGRGESARD